MKKLHKLIKEQRGDSYIGTILLVVVSLVLIVLFVNFSSIVIMRQQMDYFGKELLNTATVYGQIGNEVQERYEELKEQTGLSPVVSWDAEAWYNASDKKVQLADKITLTLTIDTVLPGFDGFADISLPLQIKHSSLSRRYWK